MQIWAYLEQRLITQWIFFCTFFLKCHKVHSIVARIFHLFKVLKRLKTGNLEEIQVDMSWASSRPKQDILNDKKCSQLKQEYLIF
jgi:hypothetical protein